MITYILKFLTIFFACLFKFIAGPVLGAAAGFNLLEIVSVTLGGMMTSVIAVTYLGDWFKSLWDLRITQKRKKFTPRTRKIVRIWKKFGTLGIAVLTPIILTPIGGTIVLTTFNVKKRKIFTYMLGSGLFWALILGYSIHWLLNIPFFDFLLR
jgi:hypothetical protein